MKREALPADLDGPAIEAVLGPLAGAIVRIVIERREATVAVVLTALRAAQSRQIAYTTVMTVMGRLHERGVLSRTRSGRQYVYRPADDEASLVDAMSQRAVDDLLRRYGTSALRQFAAHLHDLDPGLRDQLVALASRTDKPS